MKRIIQSVAASILFIATISSVWAQSYGDLVEGVSELAPWGALGGLQPLSDDWQPIVSGDGAQNVWTAAREFGSGRVLASGHEGVLTHPERRDNHTFNRNAVEWLANSANPEVGLSTGHQEWVSIEFIDDLAPGIPNLQGIALTDEDIATVDVIIVGNAWGSLTTQEIDRLENFVNNGGGLWILGLGWSFPDFPNYPMIPVAERFDIAWRRNFVQGQGTHEDGFPLFNQFFPDTPDWQSPAEAVGFIHESLEDTDSDLNEVISDDADLTPWVTALTGASSYGDLTQAGVDDGSDFRDSMPDILEHPQMVKSGGALDDDPAVMREMMMNLYLDLEPNDQVIRSEAGFTGLYDHLFNMHGVYVADNASLSQDQLRRIDEMMHLVPASMFELKFLTVNGFVAPGGSALLQGESTPNPAQLPSINIFEWEVGQLSENAFPDDGPARFVDQFTSTLAHEVNHLVDVTSVSAVPERDAWRNRLIAEAGDDPMNYLRSMFEPGFFTNAPQEFVASISNQWFTDSESAFTLGMSRFDGGRRHPLEQAVFFADLYASGDTTLMFTYLGEPDGIEMHTASLERDGQGRITRIRMRSGALELSYDGNDAITGYSFDTEDGSGQAFTVDDLGGLWFDPALDGSGFNVVDTDVGLIIYYYGYAANGERLWLLSSVIPRGPYTTGQRLDASLMVGTGGTITAPVHPDDLVSWGALELTPTGCTTATVRLVPDSGDPVTFDAQLLIGARGQSCTETPVDQ